MHVRLEDAQPREFRWRGVALDEFTGHGWRKSNDARRSTDKRSDKGSSNSAPLKRFIASRRKLFPGAARVSGAFCGRASGCCTGDFLFAR